MWGLVCLLVVFGVNEMGASNACTKESIEPAWHRCDEEVNITDETSLNQMCGTRLESFIQCKKDAVGDCQTREEFREQLFMYDTEKWAVYYRLICADANPQYLFRGGCVDEKVCDPDEANTFNPGIKDKKALCSMYAKTRECVSVPPGGTCTAANAKFQEEIKKLGYSISICDNTDIKYLYQKYGDTSTSSGETPRIVILLHALSVVLYRSVHVLLRH